MQGHGIAPKQRRMYDSRYFWLSFRTGDYATKTNQIKNFSKMKVRASIKKRSEDCKIVKRGNHLYVICKKNPKFKMRQK